jgi:hypothetical protein
VRELDERLGFGDLIAREPRDQAAVRKHGSTDRCAGAGGWVKPGFVPITRSKGQGGW